MLPVFSEVFCLSKGGVRDEGVKETINGGSQMDFIDELLYTDNVPFLFLADVQKLFRKTFSSPCGISSNAVQNLVPPGLGSHSVTLR